MPETRALMWCRGWESNPALGASPKLFCCDGPFAKNYRASRSRGQRLRQELAGRWFRSIRTEREGEQTNEKTEITI
jgi:hypothetical protein